MTLGETTHQQLSPETTAYVHGHKVSLHCNQVWTVFWINNIEVTKYLPGKLLLTYTSDHTQKSSNWTINLNVKEIIRLPKINTGEYICDLSIRKDFPHKTQKEPTVRKNIDKLEFVIIKSLYIKKGILCLFHPHKIGKILCNIFILKHSSLG